MRRAARASRHVESAFFGGCATRASTEEAFAAWPALGCRHDAGPNPAVSHFQEAGGLGHFFTLESPLGGQLRVNTDALPRRALGSMADVIQWDNCDPYVKITDKELGTGDPPFALANFNGPSNTPKCAHRNLTAARLMEPTPELFGAAVRRVTWTLMGGHRPQLLNDHKKSPETEVAPTWAKWWRSDESGHCLLRYALSPKRLVLPPSVEPSVLQIGIHIRALRYIRDHKKTKTTLSHPALRDGNNWDGVMWMPEVDSAVAWMVEDFAPFEAAARMLEAEWAAKPARPTTSVQWLIFSDSMSLKRTLVSAWQPRAIAAVSTQPVHIIGDSKMSPKLLAATYKEFLQLASWRVQALSLLTRSLVFKPWLGLLSHPRKKASSTCSPVTTPQANCDYIITSGSTFAGAAAMYRSPKPSWSHPHRSEKKVSSSGYRGIAIARM